MTEETHTDIDEHAHAGVRVPPPLIFLVFIVLGAIAEYFFESSLGIPRVVEIAGLALLLFGIAVAILVNAEFRRRKTPIEPWKPTTTIVKTGFYRYSRNPIYLGFCIAEIGIGLYADSVWIVASSVPTAILLYIFAIAKEETYLERKFGQEYLQYKSQVRRWL